MVDSSPQYREKVSQLISWGHWFCFFNIFAAMALGIRYILHSDMPSSLLGLTYLGLNWFGHFSFLCFAIYLLILFPATFVVPSQRLMRLFAVLVSTVGLTVMLLDTHAYETLNLHLSPLVWDLLVSGERTEVNARWQYLFVSVPLIFLLQMVLSEVLWRKLRKLTRRHVGGPIAIFFTLCFVSSHLIYVWGDASLDSNITSQRSTFPLSYPMTAKTFMEKHGFFDREEYAQRREELGLEESDSLTYPRQPLTFERMDAEHNVVMIMIDSLRADMVTAEIMPNLNQFAENRLRYTQHYSSSNDNMVGVFGLVYGLPGNYVPSVRASAAKPVLFEALLDNDYAFGLFSGDNFTAPIYYQAIFSAPLLKEATAQETHTDQDAITAWLDWFDSEEKQFSYLELTGIAHAEQLDTAAGKFNLPDEASMEVALLTDYKNAAYSLDKQLGLVLEAVSAAQDNTIVIITANHGLEFNETKTNSWGANSNYSRYQLQVPLIMQWPEQEAATITRQTSHLDIVPTLMESLLQASVPSESYSSGINLFDEDSSRRWVLAGDSRDIVLIDPKSTTVVDKYGNYTVYDTHYRANKDARPKLSNLMQVMHELKRFYANDSE
ncbi:DUF3413 domain-containing protein [Thaumasiovibrio subtropicus]|uniref:DUF3413 domain-containing protein n=1 Tax=Thaumasiovibrio subtropicus TaxID=1891207 RepID=UPI000B3502A5|nr:DUF3413 domain-containing protein [Thaumasiovibrio subtropicus]